MNEFWQGFTVGAVVAAVIIAALSFAAVAFYTRELPNDIKRAVKP